MKKFILTMTIAVIALSTGAIAKSYPAYGPDSYKAIQEQRNSTTPYLGSPYLGIAYSYMNGNVDVPQVIAPIGFEADVQGDNLSIVGGYNFLSFLAVEGRYTKTIGDLDLSVSADGFDFDKGVQWGGNMTNVGLYFKPQYTSSNVTIYALLGMGHVKIDLDYMGEDSSTEFQWGAGISINAGNSFIGNSNLGLFLDYTRLYDGEFAQIDVVVDVVNVGLTFTF